MDILLCFLEQTLVAGIWKIRKLVVPLRSETKKERCSSG